MADSTLQLTFEALRIRVAEYLGLASYGSDGTGAAALPTDTHDLDLVGRLVNDGYARFLADNPKGWNFMVVPLSITFGTGTVSSDNARYYLPDDSDGDFLEPFTYAGSNAAMIQIRRTTEADIRRLQAATDTTTGDPVFFATRAINTDETLAGKRWEAVFWPTPSGTQTVTAMYKRLPGKLTNDTDTSVAGPIHDQTILEAALAAAELRRNDIVGPHEGAYQQRLKISLTQDARTRGNSPRDYGDKGGREAFEPQFSVSYYGVTQLD